MWRTRVCDALGIEFPIILGGMSLAGNAELVAAVSNAGGLGVLGGNPGWSPPEKREENLRKSIRRVKELTNKPFGANFTLFGAEGSAPHMVEMALGEGVPVIVCSGGTPKLLTRVIKDAGARSIHVVGSVRQARGAEAAGVDVVVCEGYEAGGVDSPEELTTMVLVPQVADAVKIPVVAAGGISDARAFVAALILGAEGVQMGTRFLATRECHVHEKFKQAIVAAEDTGTIITGRALGDRRRTLKNQWSLRVAEMDRRGAAEEEKAFIGFGRAREGQMDGDVATGQLDSGQVAGAIREVLTAAEVVQRMIKGADSALDRVLELRMVRASREAARGA